MRHFAKRRRRRTRRRWYGRHETWRCRKGARKTNKEPGKYRKKGES